MQDSTFNRIEKKCLISYSQYLSLKSCINQHMRQDKHSSEPTYLISNIYYDTPQNLIIKKSVSKPAFKEKLRLRAYGDVSEDRPLFFEMKKKYNGQVNKRRTKITQTEADILIYEQRMPEIKPYHNVQVLKEILYYIQKYKVVPALYISYEREAYCSEGCSDLRITFDRNILTRRNYLKLGQGSFGEKLIDDNHLVLEIKSTRNIPIWLLEILNQNRIYETGFSKYGAEFYNYLYQEKSRSGGQKTCGLNPYLRALR